MRTAALLLVCASTAAIANPVSGGLTSDVVSRVIVAHATYLRACYQSELAHAPGLAGSVVFSFDIEPTGVVSSARVVHGTLDNAKVVDCLHGEIMRLLFPTHLTRTHVDSYPLIFSQGG